MMAVGPRPIAIDVFSGAGGLSLGLEQAGFDIGVAIDSDPYHIATYQRNFPYSRTLCTPVQEVTTSLLREALGHDSPIDLVCGGPPCQGFSHMGKRNAADPRNALVHEFVRLVVDLRPKAFLLENVPGIQVGATADSVSRAVSSLADSGYQITNPIRTLDAADFGVPQRRHRVFIFGVHRDWGKTAEYPTATCPHRLFRPTVWEAISDIPCSALEDGQAYPATTGQNLHSFARLARNLLADPCDLSYPRDWDGEECLGCLQVRHSAHVEELYAATAPGALVPAHHLPRLHPNGIAPTLRAGTDSEHGSYNAPRPVHPYQPRCITVREAARLHGYPDWFAFYPRKWHAHREIGNSVCPPVAMALGKAILAALAIEPAKPERTLALGKAFELPSAPRHHPRISQLEEWPKVLKSLFAQAGLRGDGRLRRSSFTVEDVQRAYVASEARMPRVPPARFLAEIASSRNAHHVLAPILKQGFSILPAADNGTYGRFVRVGTPGTLEATHRLAISRDELTAARKLELALPAPTELSPNRLLSCLSVPAVVSALFDNGRLEWPANGTPPPPAARRITRNFLLLSKAGQRRRGIAIVSLGREFPRRAAIQSLLARQSVSLAVVVARHTTRHFSVILLRLHAGDLAEMRRAVFEVDISAVIEEGSHVQA